MTFAQPHLVDTGCGHTVSYRGKSLYSPRNPRGAAIRRVEKLEIQPGTLVFVPSLGLGYGLAELLEKLPPSCHIFCVEADERLFKLGISREKPLPESARLTIIRTDRPEHAAAAVQKIGPWKFRRVVPLHLCAGYQFHRRTYGLLLEAVEEELRLFWQNKLTLVLMAELWLKNLFTNLRSLPAAGDIADLATELPILVCGAGPSLESSLDWIRKVRERVILMSVDTALPALAAAALLPDWVFTLDAQMHTLDDFVPCRDPRIALICDLTSNPLVLRLFPNIFFCATRFYPLSLFDRLENASLLPPSLPPRGSVGVSAVEAALSLTSGPVLFTGLDFSYTENQSHARSTPSHLRMLRGCHRLRPCGMNLFENLLNRPRLWLAGKSGNRVLTDLVLQSYAGQLRSVCAEAPGCFDLSREGLPVDCERVTRLSKLVDLCGRAQGSAGEKRGAARGASGSPKRLRADPEAVERFCRREQELLSEVERSIAQSGRLNSEALSSVEYLLLPSPQAGPDQELSPRILSRVETLAGNLRVCLERTRRALKAGG
jgi:hypothetical protein